MLMFSITDAPSFVTFTVIVAMPPPLMEDGLAEAERRAANATAPGTSIIKSAIRHEIIFFVISSHSETQNFKLIIPYIACRGNGFFKRQIYSGSVCQALRARKGAVFRANSTL